MFGKLLHTVGVGAAAAVLVALRTFIDAGADGVADGTAVEALVIGAILALVSRLLGSLIAKLPTSVA